MHADLSTSYYLATTTVGRGIVFGGVSLFVCQHDCRKTVKGHWALSLSHCRSTVKVSMAIAFTVFLQSCIRWCSGPVGIEYRTRNHEVAGLTHTRSTASNLEQVANILCAQANSDSHPQRDGK